jgi:tetratricopeptide (TPR) repeat protein
MDNWVNFLSGHVPGGIILYIVLLIVTFIILLFMHWVNELFSRKHLIRWMAISVIVYTIIYLAIWLKNPPPQVYKRYSVGLMQSNTTENWFGEYVTHFIAHYTKSYVTEREYLFPYQWFYRVTPADSAMSQKFIQHIYRTMPVHKVLSGNINKDNKEFSIILQLIEYPEARVAKQAEAKFHILDQTKFIQWIIEEFKPYLPFKRIENSAEYQLPDSLLVLMARDYFLKRYEKCIEGKFSSKNRVINTQELELWKQYATIKLAGQQKLSVKSYNPYSKQLPEWRLKMQKSRSRLMDYLRAEQHNDLTNLLVAESFIWEEDYASAEIFLEKEYIENPFNIDVLMNLTFLHFSRYQEFGFKGIGDIYEKILAICPIDEPVLLKWSDDVIQSNPSHAAPPKTALKMVQYYLKMNPHSYKAWLMLGKIYASGLDRYLALESFLKADSIRPNSGIINYNIGTLYYEWEKYDLAKERLKRAIQSENHLDAYLYLGVVLKEEGRYEEALEKFRYRVAHKQGEDDFYAYQAMKGIQECLEALGQSTEE